MYCCLTIAARIEVLCDPAHSRKGNFLVNTVMAHLCSEDSTRWASHLLIDTTLVVMETD